MPGRRLRSVELSFEEAAMTKAIQAQDQSFDALFAGHYRHLARLIYRIVGDTGYAEELASEAFWRLHRSPPAFDRNLAGWLYRTGLRLALDGLKMKRRRASYESAAIPTTPVTTPEQDFARRQERERVRKVLASLKPDFALLLMLRSEGFTLKEAAAALDCDPASVGHLYGPRRGSFPKGMGETVWKPVTG